MTPLAIQRRFWDDSARLPGALRAASAVIASAVIVVAVHGTVWHLWAQGATEPSGAAVAPPQIGTLSWPMPGAEVTQGFGPSPYSIEPAFGGYSHFHTGVDLQAPPETQILAAAGGVVTSVTVSTAYGPRAGYGTYVVINHGRGLTTLYAHLASAFVRKGQFVVRGQAIGRQGSTGNSTGPHLHFEVRVNGIPVDPARCFPPGTSGPLAPDGVSIGAGNGASSLPGEAVGRRQSLT